MPAQTVMQVRRDTAANWSSTNPVLANGEMGYDTTNKLFKMGDGSTAWNSLKVMAQHDTGSAARPMLTGGAYLDGSTGLVLSGLSANYASAPDSASLSITGDIDIKVKATLTDWTPASSNVLIGKWLTSGNQRSYDFFVNTSGALVLQTSTSGTAIDTNEASTVATGITDGTSKWVRATMDADNGSSQTLIKFYTSDDGTTWTQLGTTKTIAGARTIFDGTAPLDIGAFTGGSQLFTVGTIERVIIQSAYDTADNTTSLQFDADFSTQTADALAFTSSSANGATAATVTINTTRYGVGIPGQNVVSTSTRELTGNRTHYTLFYVDKAISVDLIAFEVTSGPASNATVYTAIYAADDNGQPSGGPLFEPGGVSVSASTTGGFSRQATPVTLQPGAYLIAVNPTVTMTLRSLTGGRALMAWPLAGTIIRTMFVSATITSFPNPGTAWNTRTATNTSLEFYASFRWKAA